MSDLIERQAAIDAVSEACFELRGVFGRCEDAIKALPSAQPEVDCQKCVFCGFAGFKQFQTEQPNVPDTNVGEIISILSDIRSKYNCLNAAERPYYHALSEAINALSEQPEIIRCKDCRWGRKICGNIECFADANVPPEYHGYEWFCPNGERRTDE